MPSAKRLAFFNHGWNLSPFALQLAQALAGESVGVDFFYDFARRPAADVKNYSHTQNLCLIHLPCPWDFLKTRANCMRHLDNVQDALLTACREKRIGSYAALVGIEKKGLAIAAKLGRSLGIPHIHWSLELYTASNPGWMSWIPCGDFWLEMEEDAYKSALAIIIQDEDRASALRDAMETGGLERNFLYLPVSINAANVQPRGGYSLHDLYGIDRSRKILLCYGHNRMSVEWILAMRDSLPEPWILVLHGLYMPGLEEIPSDPRLVISSNRQPESEIPALIASAHAGLVYYKADDINQTLTAFASEKLARYLCAGVPIITVGIRNIHRLFDECPCGVSITEPQQIAAALRTLEKNEEIFRKTAIRARKKYLFEMVSSDVMQFFRELTHDGTPSRR